MTADPALATSEAQLRASEERVRQARAPLLPNLALQGSSSHSRFYPDETGLDRDFYADRWAVQLNQPLFRPEYLSDLDSSHNDLAAAHAQLDAATDDLATRLATAYFDLLSAREVLRSLIREQVAADVQRAAARRSFDKGTAAVTEMLDAEAKYDVTTAQKDGAEHDYALKHEAFKQLIGGNEFELSVLPESAPDPEPVGDDLNRLLEEALERNPVAQQAQLQVRSSDYGISKARRGHLPTLDLTASYGSDQTTGTPSNPVPVHGNTAQAQVSLNIPIFSGFGTDAKIGEALALRDKQRADLETAERTVASNVREAYFGLKSALSQVQALRTAIKSTETAVRAQHKGFSVGMSDTTDVLKAETLYSQTRRDFMKAKLDARLNRIKLQIALGRPWRESIDELSHLLVPEHQMPSDEDLKTEPATP